ncbi:replication initiation protein [Fibrella forsythiae]|uniref:Replication initiation protein n=1 Tax=Fibrella forsythiae TaxID=2817061 RepID=A0ABS3JT57_9BACT|nr:replication initiation protein [Fibrella forsythiae]MBO0953138.1 replication initiation protein [Fibrella forsythiae]
MARTSLKPAPSEQFELFATDTSLDISIASIVQEPLELLLAKNKHRLSVFDRRIYWWILSRLARYQTTETNEPIPIPDQNLVFDIPVLDLYPKQATGKQQKAAVDKKRRGSFSTEATYAHFKEIAKSLVEKSIIDVDHMTTIDPDSRQVGSIAIFPRALYRNGVMQVHLDRYIVPAMCMLGKGYTKYEREAAMSLSREASQILYVRLCRFLDFGYWSPSVDELRLILEATHYARYSNFKQRVLLPVVEELNTYSDLRVEFKEILEGIKVVRIHFTIYARRDEPKLALKQLRESLQLELESVYAMSLEQRQAHALNAFSVHYSFTPLQQKQILENETRLNKFFELHLKITDGLISIKKSPTSYLAAILFPKQDTAPRLL